MILIATLTLALASACNGVDAPLEGSPPRLAGVERVTGESSLPNTSVIVEESTTTTAPAPEVRPLSPERPLSGPIPACLVIAEGSGNIDRPLSCSLQIE
jgi:hypothetical protein